MIDYNKKEDAIKKIKDVLKEMKDIDLTNLTEHELDLLITNKVEFIVHQMNKVRDKKEV